MHSSNAESRTAPASSMDLPEVLGSTPTPSPTGTSVPEEGSLFVPVIPGGTPRATPSGPPPPFIPSEIPAPMIQATPEAFDLNQSDMSRPRQTSPALPPSQEPPAVSQMLTELAPPVPPAPTIAPSLAPEPISTQTADSGFSPSALPLPASRGPVAPRPTPVPITVRSAPEPAASPTPRRTTQTMRRDPVQDAVSGANLSTMMTRARANRDANLATQVGWAQFQRKDYAAAANWFEQAIGWNTDLGEAYYGLALTRFTQGETSQAEAIAGYRINAFPKMKTLMGDILVRRGMEDYEARQYVRSIEAFNGASQYRRLSRPEEVIRGWSYYYAKDYATSANLFERLYRASPDRASAEGLYASLSRTKDWERLEMVAAEVPGPLGEIYMTYDTEQYYKSGLYLAAYDSNERAFPALENIDSPSAALGFEYSQKSGQPGESKLQTLRVPVLNVKLYPLPKVEVSATIARVDLNSSSLAPNANVGTPPDFQERIRLNEESLAAGGPPVQIDEPYVNAPTVNLNNLYEGKIRIEYQDWFSPYVEIGMTPVNGPLASNVIGKAGATYRHSSGYINAEFYSNPIRETMLSYVGLQDPYSSRKWGRVQETGGSLSLFQGFMDDYTAFAKGSYGTITGVNTASNNHLALVASVSRLIKLEGFEYITIGPSISYERFDNNQNFFTYGHGGYFSPEYIVQGIIEAQFLTTEGLHWLVKGSLGAGGQQNQQGSSPYFPLDPDGREYPGTDSTTGIFLTSIEAGYLVTPEFMVGAKLGYAVTADYNEGFASIYMRYFFEPRAGLFRTDLGFSYW